MDYSAPFLNLFNPPSFSDWRLDGSSVAYSSASIVPESDLSSIWNRVLFNDAPARGHSYFWGDIRCKADFKDYVMFEPEGSGSIPVTLGIITWSCHGNSPAVGVLNTNIVVGPSGPNGEDAFPEWEHQYSPGSKVSED